MYVRTLHENARLRSRYPEHIKLFVMYYEKTRAEGSLHHIKEVKNRVIPVCQGVLSGYLRCMLRRMPNTPMTYKLGFKTGKKGREGFEIE
jgi:hypothetical protein